MFSYPDFSVFHRGSPSLFHSFTEVPRTWMEISTLLATFPALLRLPRGDHHPVLILPGFLASDQSTLPLRSYLLYMGYEPLPWTLGRNFGRIELFEKKLLAWFGRIAATYDTRISLIGQSLGGVYARNIAHRYPERVRQVITLGSPFASMTGRSVNPLVESLFRRQSGLSIQEIETRLRAMSGGGSPPVPTTAIFSRSDGVVNWRGCREDDGHQTESIEIRGSHCGMGFNPFVYYILADRLSQPEGQWRQFDVRKIRRLSGGRFSPTVIRE